MLLNKTEQSSPPRAYIHNGRNKEQVMIKVPVNLAIAFDPWGLNLSKFSSTFLSFFAFSVSVARFYMCLFLSLVVALFPLVTHYLEILKTSFLLVRHYISSAGTVH